MNFRLACVLSVLTTANAAAQSLSDVDPHVHVTVNTAPANIHLEWSPSSDAPVYSIRKRPPGGAWQQIASSLDSGTLFFDDPDVQIGQLYEYDVAMARPTSSGNGYVLAGIEVPFPDAPGRVLVVVDQTMEAPLSDQLTRLESDLSAEGWLPQRIKVMPDAGPTAMHALIRAAYDLAPADTHAAILLGGVPRAFSGSLYPDGEASHLGAWPADGYFGDMADGGWTDVVDYGALGNIRDNRAGDGYFDQSTLPNELALAVGRVDTLDMPTLGMDPTALLGRYLDHDHAFRTGAVRIPGRGWVSDTFSYFGGEAFARMGYRDTTAIFGSEVETGSASFFDSLEADGGYAFAAGSGGGNSTYAGGVGSTTDFATRHPNAVYIGIFGGYSGDWAFQDDLLRAALLGPGVTLATTWFGRPHSHFHQLGALWTFGEAFLGTLRHGNGDYDTSYGEGGVHQALLGDPTLRMFVTAPPGNLTATAPAGQGVILHWTSSVDSVVGYHVYRQAVGDSADPIRLTPSAAVGNQFADPTAVLGQQYSYRVVAVQHLVTGSGTFFNHSPGLFAQATATPAAPDAGTTEDGGTRDGGELTDAGNDVSPHRGCGCGYSGFMGVEIALVAFLGLALRQRRGIAIRRTDSR